MEIFQIVMYPTVTLFICQYALEIKAHDLPTHILISFMVIVLNITAFYGVLLHEFVQQVAGGATQGSSAFLLLWYLLNPHVTV